MASTPTKAGPELKPKPAQPPGDLTMAKPDQTSPKDPGEAPRPRRPTVRELLAQQQAICARRGVQVTLQETLRVAAAPSAPAWQARWERAVAALGLPLHRLPSGAGHDAMKLHELMPQAMLFVRGQNGGISHNPLESTTSDDMQLAVEAFAGLLEGLASESC